MQVLAFAGKEFLHQGHAESLSNAAFDLAFNQSWIDGAANIVRSNNFQNAHCAELNIHRNFRQVRAESVDRVWNSLPVFIEWSSWRIECLFGGEHVAVAVQRQIVQSDS